MSARSITWLPLTELLTPPDTDPPSRLAAVTCTLEYSTAPVAATPAVSEPRPSTMGTQGDDARAGWLGLRLASLASTRLSISAPIRSTSDCATASEYPGPSSRWAPAAAAISSRTASFMRTRYIASIGPVQSSVAAAGPARAAAADIVLYPESGTHPVIPENPVERDLVGRRALGQPAQHEHAGQAELAPGEPAAVGAADADRPRRDLAAREFLAGLRIDDVRAAGQDRPGAEHCPGPDPGAVHDHAPGADERLVLDHHRDRVRRLEHAAYAHAACQVHVLADLRAGADGRPGVHHRPGVHVGPDVHERRHQHAAGRDVGAPAHDRAGHGADPLQPRGERYPVVIAEVAGLRDRHRQQPECQQDRPPGALVHHDPACARIRPGHPDPAGIDLVDRPDHGGPLGRIVRAQLVAPGPELINGRRKNRPGGRSLRFLGFHADGAYRQPPAGSF